MARNYSSIAEVKTLADNVPQTGTNSDKVTVLPNTTGLPTVPFVLVLNPDTSNEEVVLATSLSGSTYTVTRNIEGGGVKTHTAGQTVKHMIVGSDLQIVHDHFSQTDTSNTSTVTAHGVTGGVVGRTNSQILTNKSISLTNNTLTGTTAEFNTALTDANFATTALLEARVPVGAVNMWVTGTAPSGWLLCQGQELAVDGTYNALSQVIGTNYGALTNGSGAAGTTHFRLPDLRGRVPMGVGTGTTVDHNNPLTARAFNATDRSKVSNAETVTLTEAQMPVHTHIQNEHNHTQNPHGHTFQYALNVGPPAEAISLGAIAASGAGAFNDVASNNPQTATNQNAGGTAGVTQAHNNVQPSTVINFIIKF
jgi:microcystin-dependent protein